MSGTIRTKGVELYAIVETCVLPLCYNFSHLGLLLSLPMLYQNTSSQVNRVYSMKLENLHHLIMETQKCQTHQSEYTRDQTSTWYQLSTVYQSPIHKTGLPGLCYLRQRKRNRESPPPAIMHTVSSRARHLHLPSCDPTPLAPGPPSVGGKTPRRSFYHQCCFFFLFLSE